jgi:predicted hydrocarbon binding protein
MSEDIRFDKPRGTIELASSRLVFHCHHYNVFLQRSIEDAIGARAMKIQVDAATEVGQKMLAPLYAADGGADLPSRLARAAAIFGSLGFGRADVSGLGADGGSVVLAPCHYAIGWSAKFGQASAPVSHFATGFFRGALTAATGLASERVDAVQVLCAAMGHDKSEIQIRIR